MSKQPALDDKVTEGKIPSSQLEGESAIATPSPDQVQPSRRNQTDLRDSLRALSARKPGFTRYWREALAVVSRHYGAPCSALKLSLSGSEICEKFEDPNQDFETWRRPVAALQLDCQADGVLKARILAGPSRDTWLATAIPLGIACCDRNGTLALVARVSDKTDARKKIQDLQDLAIVLDDLAPPAPDDKAAQVRAEAANAAIAKAEDYESIRQFAFALTNNLRAKTNCEQVTMGINYNGRARIISISGVDETKPNCPATRHLREAMGECFDRGRAIFVQNDGKWADEALSTQHRIHRQWHDSYGSASVATLPLLHGDKVVGAITLQRDAKDPFSPDEATKIEELVKPYGSAFALVERANQGLARHGLRRLLTAFAWLGSGRAIAHKFALVAVTAGILFLCFGTLPYRIPAATTLRPGEVQHSAAPFEGRLMEAPYRVGDRVKTGDLLYRFDTRELQLQKTQFESETAVLTVEIDRALAEGRRVDATIARRRQEVLRVQVATIDRRILRATARASQDGMIISGDLRPRIGDLISQGEPLFEIAPDRQRRLELAIPESDILDLKPGMEGVFATNARPESPLKLIITRVRPSAEIVDGKNVFVAEASLAIGEDSAWLRPGLEGVSRLEVGHRKVWWLVSNRAIAWLQLEYGL
ncbi:MAG: HlyD family efflux transporter periplasmic adaptor subunit [Planctomycetota bacterium]